jgi:short-subunit dehydrogenase
MKLSTQQALRIKKQYGSWALITGSSSGIGLAIATALAKAGVNVILHGRRAAELQRISTLLQESYRIEAYVVSSDLSSEEGIQEVLRVCVDKPIGLFVASAGFGTSGFFHEAAIENEISMLRVNAESLMILVHHFSKRFIAQERGGIILLSSMVGFQGVPYAAHYAATKAYVQSLGEALAVELKPFGVDVLTAAPGPVESEFGKRANLKMDMTLTPNQVAIPILNALGRKDTILPGWLTKFLVYSLRTVPRWGKVRIMQKVMGGMTQHQRKINV